MARRADLPSRDPLPARIALVGLMGSGKTTVGALLARRLGYAFIDMDARLVRETGRSVPRLFEEEGESGFRRREALLLKEIAREDHVVVSTGGGVVLRAANRRTLSTRFTVFWLRVGARQAARRVGSNRGRPVLSRPVAGRRPSLEARLAELSRQRTPLYEEVGRSVRTGGRTPREITELILKHLGC